MKPSRLISTIIAFIFAFNTNAQVRGDVNQDLSTDISDIVAVINVIAGDSQYSSTADVNEDKEIDISDIVAIINIIVGPGYDQKQYDTLVADIKRLIRSNDDITYSDVSAYLNTNKYVESYEVEDGTMYISTTDGMELQVDLNGEVELEQTDDDELDVDSLSDQIHEALGYDLDNMDETTAKTRREMVSFSAAAASSKFKANAVIDDGQILTSKKILVWAPWKQGFDDIKYNVERMAKRHGLNCEVVQGGSCTLGSMLNFSNYPLVVLVCHGNKRGELCLPPTDYWKNYLGCPGFSKVILKYTDKDVDMEEYISLNPLTGKCIPNMKFKTIIWTIMCHAGVENSAIRKACENQCAAAFTGASKIVNAYCPLKFLLKFTALFFNEGKGGVPVSYAFSGKLTQDKSLDYEFTTKRRRIVEGKYNLSVNKNVEFKTPNAIRAKINKPRAYLTMLYNTIVKKKPMVLAASSSTSYDYIEAGFRFVNTSTGETKHVPFSAENVDSYQLYDYQDILSRCVITGKTDDLPPGKYIYHSYLKTIDGIVYSDEGHEFEVEEEDPAVLAGLCPDSHHPHAIDLGLGVKWACCNVGASAPWEYGGYYAWGETEEKNYYSPSTYTFAYVDDDGEAYETVSGQSYSYKNIGNDIFNTNYDVAHVKWGGGWCMPCYTYINSLINQCSREWISVNSVYGRKCTGPSGASIFLPAAGSRRRDTAVGVGTTAHYRSSTQSMDQQTFAYNLFFDSRSLFWLTGALRDAGCSVRPVKE